MELLESRDETPLGERRSRRRRALARSDLRATATIVSRGETVGRFTVQNLSAGGALLIGGHDVPRAAPCRVLLELPSGESIAVGAWVRRRAVHGGLVALAISFRHSSPASEDRIQDAILGMLDRHRKSEHPAVLVVDSSPAERHALVVQLCELGHRAIGCAAPLEAIRRLDDPDDHVRAVLVRDAAGARPGVELLELVADTYADVRPILLVEDPAADPKVEHRAVMRCRPEHLAGALG